MSHLGALAESESARGDVTAGTHGLPQMQEVAPPSASRGWRRTETTLVEINRRNSRAPLSPTSFARKMLPIRLTLQRTMWGRGEQFGRGTYRTREVAFRAAVKKTLEVSN